MLKAIALLLGMSVVAIVYSGCEAADTDGAVERPSREAALPRSTVEDPAPELESNEALMTRSDYGRDWPLTVDQGIVRCEGAGEVYFEAEGTTYAVNGLALGRDRAPRIDRIWAPDPQIKGLKIDIGPIIDTGLELCE